jgi:hypothetical protein
MTAQTLLTNVAGGSGLAKPWLAETEGSNRASSVSMAEPVRRRVQSVQRSWQAFMTTVCRFVVDEAVRSGRLPRFQTLPGVAGEPARTVPTWRTVRVEMPEIAATDAQINATILSSLAVAVPQMVGAGLLGPEAGRRMLEHAWSDYMGQPWRPGIDSDATVKAWQDKFGAAAAPKAPAPGGAPGVDNAMGTPGMRPMTVPGEQTAKTGAPIK